jgi:hypothetical protein
MSTTSVTATSGVANLAKLFAERADANKDGAVSTSEFTSFLVSVLSGSITKAATTTTTKSSASTSSTGGDMVYSAMPGWDTARLNNPEDLSGKYVFGRWAQGKPATTEMLQQFVAEHPDWEMRGSDGLRMKQEALDKLSPGRQSVWQDVIFDVGGPDASWQFINAD